MRPSARYVHRQQRDQFTVIAKVGQSWSGQRQRVVDGSARDVDRGRGSIAEENRN